MAEEESWLENLKRLGSGLFPEPPKPRPAVDMAHWGPVLEAADPKYDKNSPEYKLLEAISKHANSAPMPQEVSTGRKLIGTGFNAIGAGLARGAGASVEGALKPTGDMISDWNHRRDLADQGRMNAWKAGGDLVIPRVSDAVQMAAQLKRLREVSDGQRERFGYPRIYNTEAPAAGAPAAPGGAAAKPAPGLPGTVITPPAASPGAPPAASAPQGAERRPSGAEDRPYAAGEGPNATRFYTQEWRDFFHKNFDAVTNQGMTIPAVKDKDGMTIRDEIKTPTDLHRVALQEDLKTHRESLPHLAKKESQTKNIERSATAFKAIEAETEGAARANFGLNVFDRAVADLEKAGYRTGPGQDWIASIANWTNSMPGMAGTFDQNRIANMEAIRKSSIETATEMAKAISQRGATQFEFKTIQSAVTNASLSMEGNKRLSKVIRAMNDAKVAEGTLAAKLMQDNGGQLPYDFEMQRLRVQAEHAEKLGAMLDDITREYGGDPANVGGKKGAAAPEEKLAPDQLAVARARARALIETGVSPQEAAARARQELAGQGKLSGPPPATAPAASPEPPKAPMRGRGGLPLNTGLPSLPESRNQRMQGIYKQKQLDQELKALRRMVIPQGPT